MAYNMEDLLRPSAQLHQSVLPEVEGLKSLLWRLAWSRITRTLWPRRFKALVVLSPRVRSKKPMMSELTQTPGLLTHTLLGP